MDTMIASPSVFKDSQTLQENGRCHAVPFLTLCHLPGCLRQMGIHRRLIMLRQPGHLQQKTFLTGILRMKSHPVTDQGIFAVPLQIFLFLLFYGRGKIIQPAGKHATHPRIHAGKRRSIRLQIHVEYGRNPGCQIFQYCQSDQLVDIFPCKLCLHGKHFLVQPLL